MQEIRNSDGRLMGKYDRATGIFEMMSKGCATVIRFPPGTDITVVNIKKAA